MVHRVTPEEIAELLAHARALGAYASEDEGREDLRKHTRAYRRTFDAHEREQRATIVAIFRAALSAIRPTAIEEDSPFTGAYLRRLRKTAGLPTDQRYVRIPPRSPE